MSSSFIAIKFVTNNGSGYIAELDSGSCGIDANAHDGTFLLTAADFEDVDSICDLFLKIYSWFYESLVDPDCAFDDIDDGGNRAILAQ